MTGRILAMFDIHGHFKAMNALIRAAKVDIGTDVIIFGGDIINRGSESLRVLREVYRLRRLYPENVMYIIGNHEAAFIGTLQGDISVHDYQYNMGGGTFLGEVVNHNAQEEVTIMARWITEQPMIAMTKEHVFVHSGIDPNVALQSQGSNATLWQPRKEFYAYSQKEILKATNGKIVVHGHTPRPEVEFDGARIACDLGAGVLSTGGALALVDLTNMEYWRSDAEGNWISKHTIAKV